MSEAWKLVGDAIKKAQRQQSSSMMFGLILQPLKKDGVSLCLCLLPSLAKLTSWQDPFMDHTG